MLDWERRQKAYYSPTPELLQDVRYPYLDRNLREFAFAIPVEQIVGVGKRRFLMKRALAGIVPDELLNRKQQPFTSSETRKNLPIVWPSLTDMRCSLVSSSLGAVDPDRFLEALQKAQRKEVIPIESLKRTLTLEFWLRHLSAQGVLKDQRSLKKQVYSSALGAKDS